MIKSIQHFEEIRPELYRIICKETKPTFAKKIRELADMLPDTANKDAFHESANYIMTNRTAAKLRLAKTKGKVGSSTEGHVSHVLASRMSTQCVLAPKISSKVKRTGME